MVYIGVVAIGLYRGDRQMEKKIYRGYDITQSPTGRWFIYKDGVEVYSMTSTEEEVYNWIDKDKRKQSNG